VLARVRQHPGITAAGWTTILPLNGDMVMVADVEGYKQAPNERLEFHVANVSPDYFKAAGTRLLRGRDFTAADTRSSTLVGIINETAARKYWTGRDPLQGRLGGDKPVQIVGIVEDTRIDELDAASEPFVYNRELVMPQRMGAALFASSPRSRCCSRRSASTASRHTSRSRGRARLASASRSARIAAASGRWCCGKGRHRWPPGSPRDSSSRRRRAAWPRRSCAASSRAIR
jgi:MacB-like periplasmic core domain